MKDLMNIERGKCLNELPIIKKPCPCPGYKIDENATRGACNLCECPSVMHEEILVSPNTSFDSTCPLSPLSSTLSSGSGNLRSGSSSPVVIVEVPNNVSVDDILNGPTVSTEPTSDEIGNLFPKRLPKRVEQALSTHTVDATHKNVIVQRVADRLHEEGKDSLYCLKKAAKVIAHRWSPLKNPLLPNDTTHIYTQLRKRRDKLNTRDKRDTAGNSSSNSLSTMTPEKAKLTMFDKWVQGNRNIKDYKELMPYVRPLLQSQARKSPGFVLFRHYPYLEMKDLLLEELAVIGKISIPDMERNWSITVPHLLEFLTEQKVECTSTGSLGEKTLSILESIHKVPLWFKKKQEGDNRAARILEIHSVDTVLREVQPGPRDPPGLIGLGSVLEENLSIYCYMDGSLYFTEEDPVKALLLLLSAYFVMGIKWPPHAAGINHMCHHGATSC